MFRFRFILGILASSAALSLPVYVSGFGSIVEDLERCHSLFRVHGLGFEDSGFGA